MHAVGDVANRDLVRRPAFPTPTARCVAIPPRCRADTAVHATPRGAETAPSSRTRGSSGPGTAERHELVARDAHRVPERPCHLFELIRREDVVSRWAPACAVVNIAGRADLRSFAGLQGETFGEQLAHVARRT